MSRMIGFELLIFDMVWRESKSDAIVSIYDQHSAVNGLKIRLY